MGDVRPDMTPEDRILVRAVVREIATLNQITRIENDPFPFKAKRREIAVAEWDRRNRCVEALRIRFQEGRPIPQRAETPYTHPSGFVDGRVARCPKCGAELTLTEPKNEWISIFSCDRCGFREEQDWVASRL